MSNGVPYYQFPSPSADTRNQDTPTLLDVGGKALSLIESLSAGLPVPRGFVLTVSFFEPWLDEIQRTDAWKAFVSDISRTKSNEEEATTRQKGLCDAIRNQCATDLHLNPSQKEKLDAATVSVFGDSVFDGLVAVRSSSPEEDLSGASFAGGYDTTLGVNSVNLENALVSSFSSAFDHVIVQYKSRLDMAIDKPRIAVVVQEQIASDVSGVAFGYNPSNNCFDEVMIGANFGLGESVVAGTVTPDTYIVDRSNPSSTGIVATRTVADKASVVRLINGGGTEILANDSPKDPALTDEQILEVAGLVTRVEESRGGGGDSGGAPVDIEWAFHDGKLYLLQARPVTSYIPLFPEMITARGAPKKLYLDAIVLTQGFSKPFSVFGLDVWATAVKSLKAIMSTDGPTGLVWNIHGRQYMNISNLLTMTGGHAMLDKGFRSYDKAIDRALNSIDINDYVPSKQAEGAKGIFWLQLKDFWVMLPYMFSALWSGGEALHEYIQHMNNLAERCYSDKCSKDELIGDGLASLVSDLRATYPMLGGIISSIISRARLDSLFSGQEEAKDLLINMCMDLTGNPTSEMGHAMVRLAEYPEVQDTASGEEFVKKLRDEAFSEQFTKEYNEYLKQFGCRGMMEIDAATPRSYEKQEDIFDTLKQIDIDCNQIKSVSKRRKEAYEKLLAMAEKMGKGSTFKHHAQCIQSLMGYREHPKFMLVKIIDRMRRHALNIAREFVSQRRLKSVDQIFFLSVDQITEAQINPRLDIISLVAANMEPYKKVEHIKEWPVLIDSRGKIIRGTRENKEAEDGVFLGDPISPGKVRGRAKILNEPYEKPLKSGEILVARFTEPSWTPLFINAAAVVMEVGGPMQHGAIIAREYGIPCTSGVVNATKLIMDGDVIEVDGSSGTVSIIESNDGVKVE